MFQAKESSGYIIKHKNDKDIRVWFMKKAERTVISYLKETISNLLQLLWMNKISSFYQKMCQVIMLGELLNEFCFTNGREKKVYDHFGAVIRSWVERIVYLQKIFL